MCSAHKNCCSFFSNCECEYFPCHEGIDEDEFNCIFCYCPLYALGDKCGGNFEYTDKGVKSCLNCLIPHRGETGVQIIKDRFEAISALASRPADRY